MFIRPNALSVDLICESPLMEPVLRSTRGSPATLLAMLLMYSRSRLALPLLRVPVYTLARRCLILLPESVQSELVLPPVRVRSDNKFAQSFELQVLMLGSIQE